MERKGRWMIEKWWLVVWSFGEMRSRSFAFAVGGASVVVVVVVAG